MPLGFELADELDNPRNGLTCAGKDVGGVDIESGKIRLEERGFLTGEPIPGRVELAGTPNDVIVDIGHVLDVAHLDPLRAQGPHQNVEGDVGERVAEVGGVIGRDAANVDANWAVPGLERLHRSGFGVVQPHRLTVIEARAQERPRRRRCTRVAPFFKGRGEQLVSALVITLVLMGLVALAPAVARRLAPHPAMTPAPTPSPTAPPAAVLLPDERDKALQGVMTIANEHRFGTAFLIDTQGDFVTASSLVDGSAELRLIDNTGGSHSVRVLGSDAKLGVAMLRASTDGSVLFTGDSAAVRVNDPVVLLASPKIANLNPSTPATVATVTSTTF